MNKIILFAGTTEGRKLSELLCENKTAHAVCVATEYGEQVLTPNEYAEVHQGRMDASEMEAFLRDQQAESVVDATHPYAVIVTDNISEACEKAGVRYIRLDRLAGETMDEDQQKVRYFDDTESCAAALKETEGNILLTTGSKELPIFCRDAEVKERLYVRVLPGAESIGICTSQEIPGKRIIAIQGPFSEELNTAIIHQYDISLMVTKASGRAGGFYEKMAAAEKAGLDIYMIGLPDQKKGQTFDEVVTELGLTVPEEKKEIRKISLIGCGMGKPDKITVEAAKALSEAGIVFGASRLLKDMDVRVTSYPSYLAKDILPVIRESKENCAVLFSGDTGFFSGTAKFYEALKEEFGETADIRIYPGISSVASLAAETGEKWDDAVIMSVHGRGPREVWQNEVISRIRSCRKLFLLLTGAEDLHTIGELILENGLQDIRVIAGFNMAGEDEEILELTPEQCLERDKKGLYSIFVINPHPEALLVSDGMKDEDFTRAKVPMTKEEVREVSVAKLKLRTDSVVYDVGAGTGSVSIQMAAMAPGIKVYAIERKPEAVELIRENTKKHGLYNLEVVEGLAPEGFEGLPAPTHAFIGGTGGHMKEILESLFSMNPEMRIVANAVSFETLQELLTIEDEFPVEEFEITQMAVTHTRVIGHYHMMQGENPVWICSFKGKKA